MLGEDIERDSWVYALAAHQYYWGDGASCLSDEEYDALSKILKINWDSIPEELKTIFGSKEMLGQGATHIKLSSGQYKYATRKYYEIITKD